MDVAVQNLKLAAALQYLSMGLSVIPAKADKKPYLDWKIFQDKLPTEEEVRNWWAAWPDANPALVTGKISGIVALDIDAKHGRTESEFKIPLTACSKTGGGGKHFFFKHPGFKIDTKSGIFGLGVDIRGDGGYVLLEPSVNAQGGLYEVIIPFDEVLADMPQWLLEKTSSKVIPNEKKWESGIQGVSEGDRNDKTTSVIGKLLRHIPPDEWDKFCLPLLHSLNKVNSPPLPENEVLQIYQSIKTREIQARSNKKPEEATIGESISIKALLDTVFPQVRFAIESLFETGTINMLSAPPNKWKSWVVILCAICVAAGRELFGKFKTNKQAVLIINEEDTPRLLQERLNMLMDGADDLLIYFYIGKEIKVEEKFVTQILEEAKNKNIGFIIFDSLRSVHSADENSSKEMQVIMDQFKRISRTGITVLFTHHNRKKTFGGGRDASGEDSRGSTAINAAIHGHISCEEIEKEGKKYLIISQPKLKADKKLNPFEIAVEKDDTNNKISFTYAGEHKEQEKIISKINAKLMDIFDTTNAWLSVKDLVNMNAGKATALRTCLKILEEKRQIKSLERKEVVKTGLLLYSQDGAHNEGLYIKATESNQVEGNPNLDLDMVFPP